MAGPLAALRGLIFDLDGTLVDSLDGIAASLNHALARGGFPVHDRQAVRGFIGNGARILIQRGAPHGTMNAVLLETEQAFKNHYDATWHHGTAVYDGIAPLLATLHAGHHRLAVLSNKPHDFTTAIVRAVFPDIAFDAVLGQRDGIPHKPDPAGALEIADLLGLDPAACALVGDSTVDIETARNAGMVAVAVTWGFHDRQHLSDARPAAVADTPAQLAALFEESRPCDSYNS